MRLLVLGGTVFLGRHLVEAALARGFRVTLFNRGRTAADLFPVAEKLRGDRDGDLAALRGGTWDAVVDCSGYLPRQVRATARMLAPRAGHYCFISSVSVYADPTRPGTDEDSTVHAPADEGVGEVTAATYGPLKAGCEREAEEAFRGRALIARAGLLVGPHDNVPRLAYWLRRIARGGLVLAPGAPGRPVQIVDARDAAGWLLEMAAGGRGGVRNVAGDPGALTLGRLLEGCREATAGDARFVWADDATLESEGVPPFDGLPYGVPEPLTGVMQVSIARARDEGLRFRPLAATLADTWSWLRRTPPEEPPLRRTLGGIEIVSGLAAPEESRILERLAP